MMQDIDITPLVEAAIDFFTFFLIDLPFFFLGTIFDSGVIITIWNTFFGDPNVIKVLFLLALMGGAMKYSRSLNPDADRIYKPKKIKSSGRDKW